MTDTEIRDVLVRATADVRTPPDLLDRVRAGGRRRVVRRRTLLAAALTTAAAGSTAVVLRGAAGRSGLPASPRLSLPTRGDLAGDAAYLRRVVAVWRSYVGTGGMIGEPHVAWAVTTPAGPVAVVSSRSRGASGYGWTGFVAGDRVLSLEALEAGVTNTEAVLAGPRRDVLVVVDGGRSLAYSPDFSYGSDGRVRRTFRPVVLDRDGVFVATVPAQPDRLRTALRAGTIGVRPASTIDREPVYPKIDRLLPGREIAWGDDAMVSQAMIDRWDLRQLPGYGDPYGFHHGTPGTFWFIRGSTPDRRRFVVQTQVLDADVRLFRTLSTSIAAKPVYLGLLALSERIPVLRVRLPQAQGVVVAAERAALRYRTGSTDWLPVSGDAALLPASAGELEVSKPGERSFRVPLR
jgi:hypothetical protein